METLKKLISIGSFDTNDNTEIVDYLEKKFSSAKEIVKIKEPNKNLYSLLIGLNTKVKDCNCVLLSGHIDTVNHEKNNLSPSIVDNKLYGLGAIDMKCFFASIIDNLDKLQSLQKPTIVAITCDEETDVCSIERVIEKLKERNVKPKLTVLGEPTDLKLCTYSKGCNEFKVSFTGKSCHNSAPENGINAIYIAAKFATFIETLQGKYDSTALSVGIINGGTAVNIVPGNCELMFSVRSVKHDNNVFADVENMITSLKNQYPECNITMEQTLHIPSFYQEHTPLVSAFEKKLGLKVESFNAASEAGYLKQLGGDVVIFGAGKLSLAHKLNEHLEIDKYEKYNKILLKMIEMS